FFLVGQQFRRLAVGLAQFGYIAAGADLYRFRTHVFDPIQRLVILQQVLKDKAKNANLHWLSLLKKDRRPLSADRHLKRPSRYASWTPQRSDSPKLRSGVDD